MAALVFLSRGWGLLRHLLHGRLLHRRGCHGALEDLVEFAAVQPDTSAFRAVIDLDALAFGHH
ncbi:hypothetical protein D3C81_2318390 [compost metagenome]